MQLAKEALLIHTVPKVRFLSKKLIFKQTFNLDNILKFLRQNWKIFISIFSQVEFLDKNGRFGTVCTNEAAHQLQLK